jgi:hypothetical protein
MWATNWAIRQVGPLGTMPLMTCPPWDNSYPENYSHISVSLKQRDLISFISVARHLLGRGYAEFL